MLAETAVRQHSDEMALMLLREALRADFGDCHARAGMAETLLRLGRNEEAASAALDAASDPSISGELKLRLARTIIEAGSTDDGEALCCDLLSAPELRPEALALLAKSFKLRRMPKDSIEFYKRALELDPANVSNLTECGLLMAECGEIESLLMLYRAVSVDPLAVTAWQALEKMLDAFPKLEPLADAVRRNLLVDQPPAEACLELSRLYRLEGRFDLARQASERVPPEPPGPFEVAQWQIAHCDLASGAAQAAVERIQRFYASNPKVSEARLVRSRFLAEGTGLPHGAPVHRMFSLENAVVIEGEWQVLAGDQVFVDTVVHLPRRREKPAYMKGWPGLVPEFFVFVPPKAGSPVPEAVLLGGADNYYHWLIDVLPRLSVIAARPELESLPLLVNADLTAFQQETLQLLGVPEGRLLKMAPDTSLNCGKLWIPVLGCRHAPDGHWDNHWWRGTATAESLSWLRAALLSEAPGRQPNRRLFLSRAATAQRRLINEDAVFARLEPLGFERIDPGRFSVLEQTALAAEAGIIVGAHGAGMTNVVFASPNCPVVELQGAAQPQFIKRLAKIAGQPYRMVCGISVPPARPRHTAFWDIAVDPAQVERAVLASL